MLACCIIKPPALTLRARITRALADARLLVLATAEFTYGPALVDALYDHMDIPARAEIVRRYAGRPGVALLVSAGSLSELLDAVGRESDPRACAHDSLRYRFGKHGEPDRIGDWLWWENAVHRPVDERERLRDLRLFFPGHAR